jgi:hypothetical protein
VADYFCTFCGCRHEPLDHCTKPIIDYSGMEPRKNPRQPIFRDHNCGGCSDGERPCREGNYNNCSNPRARND